MNSRRRVFSGAEWEAKVGYCRAVVVDGQVFIGGTAPVMPGGGTHAPGDAYAQTQRCLDIIEAALAELGGGLEHVVRTRLYVTDISRWPEIGRAHAERLGQNPPATTMVEVRRLIADDMIVEIEADAVLGGLTIVHTPFKRRAHPPSTLVLRNTRPTKPRHKENRNMARHWKLLGALSLVGLFAVGCSDQAEATSTSDAVAQGSQAVTPSTATADASKADASKAADARGDEPCDKAGRGGPPGRGHHPGPDFLLQTALHELDLTADQKSTIEAAVARLDPRGKERAPKEPRANPIAGLAASVRAGKVDASSLPARPAVDAEMAAHHAELASAIQTLHTTLTPAQRTALVAAIEKRAENFGPPPGFDKQAASDKRADSDRKGERGPGLGHDRKGPPGGPMFFLRGLDLTESQQTSIKQALDAQRGEVPSAEVMKQRFEAMRTGMKARLATFATDSFDAKAFLAPPEGADAGKHFGPDHMIKELAVVVPLLTAEQREKLATQLEKGPGAFGPGGRHGGHHGRGPQGAAQD